MLVWRKVFALFLFSNLVTPEKSSGELSFLSQTLATFPALNAVCYFRSRVEAKTLRGKLISRQFCRAVRNFKNFMTKVPERGNRVCSSLSVCLSEESFLLASKRRHGIFYCFNFWTRIENSFLFLSLDGCYKSRVDSSQFSPSGVFNENRFARSLLQAFVNNHRNLIRVGEIG